MLRTMLVSVALLVLAVGCGPPSEPDGFADDVAPVEAAMLDAEPVREGVPASEAQDLDEVVVVIKNTVFQPKQIRVARGTTVTWINDDAADHTVTSGTRREPTEMLSVVLGEDEGFSFAFEEAGTYKYHCSTHMGMNGKVIVE